MTYHYQCASCYCTLYWKETSDEAIYSVINGCLCGSCQMKKERAEAAKAAEEEEFYYDD